MTVPDAFELLDYWRESPPEHEMLAMFARVYTTWQPGGGAMTEEQARVEHQKSLKQRWDAGARSAKDLVGMGGALAMQSPQGR
jgi:hypothetical protein